jgi:hypothetical protein
VTDQLCLGDSLEAMRLFDVLRAVEMVESDPEVALGDRPVHLLGIGRGALHGRLAAALDARIRRIELRDERPDPHAALTTRLYPADPDWHCLLPGMPSHLDLADLGPLFAGRQVVHESATRPEERTP